MLELGLYEQVINKALTKQLAIETEKQIETERIDIEEAPVIFSKYIAEVVQKCLRQIRCDDISEQLSLVNKIVHAIIQATGDDSLDDQSIDMRAEQLLAVMQHKSIPHTPSKTIRFVRPETSLSASSLFTGAIHEPSMMTELKKEICSADRVDMLVSFIKWSGLRLIMNDLAELTNRGGQLRIITTSYMGATDAKAISELSKLSNTKIKISYDTKRTRLHAKSYLFYRNTGFTTAYIGSSNLSNAAISSGLEWNLKITASDLPETIEKMNATFESYWNSSEFSDYGEKQYGKLVHALRAEKQQQDMDTAFAFDIFPYPYQQEILDRLQAEREVRNHYKNLIVAATGTGKTIISAFDYKRFRTANKGTPCRLLFVAHREEILRQSLNCFRGVLHDANFGELFVGGKEPERLDHLFVSIQTLNARTLTALTDKLFYDFIIVDEFHHAAAPTYQGLLEYYTPKILLGLTATPERMDGKDILQYFDQRIAAEIRLPEAIDRKLLCPFQYFGVSDIVDLNDLKWVRGGYDKGTLSKAYTGNDIRTMLIIKQLRHYVADIEQVTGLGFCVSQEHAAYMSERFNQAGIPSISLTANSTHEMRRTAKSRLARGELRFIFTVDLYNEGVDIPEVNTVMFLRPTESLTVFLQQLGRGLRLSEGKECLTVLDFIGQAHKNYSFEQKFSALLSHSANSIQSELKNGFSSLPKGCYIQLEKQAAEYVLENIKRSIGSKNAFIGRLSSFFEDTGEAPTLENFLTYYHLDISSIYGTKNTFSRLCVYAKITGDFQEDLEQIFEKALGRFCFVDSRRWLMFLLTYLPKIEQYDIADFSQAEQRMWQMAQFTIWQKPYEECDFTDLLAGFRQIKKSPVMLAELLAVLQYRYTQIDFVDEQVDVGFDCPLDLHCHYSRDQILVAMDFFRPNTVREGVKYLPEQKSDLLFVTLNKAEKEYSPSTMYHDYSINKHLFHWQSQSTTSENSTTAQRYINHKANNHKILLFVREFKKDKLGASPYTFLGLADFVSSRGSKPMDIVWRLHRPIPAKFLKKTNKLVVG